MYAAWSRNPLEDTLTPITGQVSDVGMNDAPGVFHARAAEFRGDGTTVVSPAPATLDLARLEGK